jgi:hypothetical protein
MAKVRRDGRMDTRPIAASWSAAGIASDLPVATISPVCVTRSETISPRVRARDVPPARRMTPRTATSAAAAARLTSFSDTTGSAMTAFASAYSPIGIGM